MGSFPNRVITYRTCSQIKRMLQDDGMLQERTSKHCSLGNAADEEGVNVNGQLPKQGQHLQSHTQLILVRGFGFADPLAQDLQAGVAVHEDSEGLATSQLQDLQAEDEAWSKCKGM